MKENFCGIYKIISPTNKVYVGQSVNVKKRIKFYKYGYELKTQPKLNRSFVKHGVNNHVFKMIETCEEYNLNERERYWQDHYDSIDNGLNCVFTKTKTKSGRFSKETKANHLKAVVRGKKHPFWGKKGSLNPNFGDKRPSISSLLKKTRMGKDNPMYGRTIKESSKELQREKMRGNKNYLYKPILNTQTGIFYDTLEDAAKTINADRRWLWRTISKSKINKTDFIY